MELTEQQREILDELVHSIYSDLASGLNNEGPEAQMEFLEDGYYTHEQLLDVLTMVDGGG